jgi:hypothetical protein
MEVGHCMRKQTNWAPSRIYNLTLSQALRMIA